MFSEAFHIVNYEISAIKQIKLCVLLKADIHGYRSVSVVIGGLSLNFKKTVRISANRNFHGHRNPHSR